NLAPILRLAADNVSCYDYCSSKTAQQVEVDVGRTKGLVAVVALISALGAGTTAARAELEPFDDYAFGDAGLSLLHGRWGAFTALYGAGAGQFGVLSEGAYPKVAGLRYTERKGHVTGLFFAILNSIAGSMAANSP